MSARTDRMYKDSPTLKRSEDGRMRVMKPEKQEKPADGETATEVNKEGKVK